VNKFLYFQCLLIPAFLAFGSISNQALYLRCYQRITGKSYFEIKSENSQQNYVAIKNEIKDPIEGCLELITKVNIDPSSGIAQNNDNKELKSVFNNLNNYFNNMFSVKEYNPSTLSCNFSPLIDFIDIERKGLYFLRTLFTPDAKFSEAVTATETYEYRRSAGVPDTLSFTVGGKNKVSDFVIELTNEQTSAPLPALLEVGDIIGFKKANLLSFGSSVVDIRNWTNHYKGGVIGDKVYLKQHLPNITADGAIKLERNFGQSFYKDFLCRDLPLVKLSDSKVFVDTSEDAVPFRQSASCVTCHASIDRLAMGMTHIGPANIRGGRCERVGEKFRIKGYRGVRKVVNFTQDNSFWPSSADPKFAGYKNQGRIFFRSYSGKLIDVGFHGAEQLGAFLSQSEDFYICQAKRAYNYLTGIDVNLNIYKGLDSEIELSDNDKANYETVIAAGLELKKHQSFTKLLKELMNSPSFKDEHYKRISQ